MRVLVATDFSEASDVALREGTKMASAPSDALGVVYALPRLIHESLFFPTRDKALEARAKELVERATTMLHGRVALLTHRPAELFVDEGIDYAAIVQRAETWRADVIVIGSHGRSGLARLVGDVAMKVAHHATCNVLVARNAGARHVVAATDFSDASLPAVSVAAAEARRRSAKLDVVHAIGFVEVEALYLADSGSPSIAAPGPDDAAIGARLHEACAKLGIDAQCEVLEGAPATAIARHAESIDAELVVVGAHGSTNLARAGIGNVAKKVLRACLCSVMIVRRPLP